MTALNIHVLAAVIDPGNPGGYREGFAADVARGITMPEKAGWPSVGHYSLTEMQGARLLAAGRHSVYYNRSALERQRALYRETAEKLAAQNLLTAGDASALQPNLPVLAREPAVTLAP